MGFDPSLSVPLTVMNPPSDPRESTRAVPVEAGDPLVNARPASDDGVVQLSPITAAVVPAVPLVGTL
jgi:hypothetical protein